MTHRFTGDCSALLLFDALHLLLHLLLLHQRLKVVLHDLHLHLMRESYYYTHTHTHSHASYDHLASLSNRHAHTDAVMAVVYNRPSLCHERSVLSVIII